MFDKLKNAFKQRLGGLFGKTPAAAPVPPKTDLAKHVSHASDQRASDASKKGSLIGTLGDKEVSMINRQTPDQTPTRREINKTASLAVLAFQYKSKLMDALLKAGYDRDMVSKIVNSESPFVQDFYNFYDRIHHSKIAPHYKDHQVEDWMKKAIEKHNLPDPIPTFDDIEVLPDDDDEIIKAEPLDDEPDDWKPLPGISDEPEPKHVVHQWSLDPATSKPSAQSTPAQAAPESPKEAPKPLPSEPVNQKPSTAPLSRSAVAKRNKELADQYHKQIKDGMSKEDALNDLIGKVGKYSARSIMKRIDGMKEKESGPPQWGLVTSGPRGGIKRTRIQPDKVKRKGFEEWVKEKPPSDRWQFDFNS